MKILSIEKARKESLVMTYTIDEIRKMIEPVAIEYELPAVYLFGSYARGEANDDSDIDIMIDDENSYKFQKMFGFGGLFEDLMNTFNKKIDIVFINGLMERDGKAGDYMRSTILSERVLIYDR
ncbi:MAG: nucleotidyltransferase domain-containing protein [Lachnospiraceae bacterium]|jgi:predicted nucleotidyltransferase|nr:nucleotidyltransferase domain-containing protein [Lachnospiraceae bacterium]